MGRVAGLLTGSMVTIIGVAMGLAPEIVFLRAAVAAIGMTILGTVLGKILEITMT